MFASAPAASDTGAGVGYDAMATVTVTAIAMSKQMPAASSSKFKPICAGAVGPAPRTTDHVLRPPVLPAVNPQPSRSTLKSPLNRLASRPASELIGARQSRYFPKSPTISTPNLASGHVADDDIDDDSSLLSLLFSPTTPNEKSPVVFAAQQQRTPPVRILPRIAPTTPTRNPSSPVSAARLAPDFVTRRALPPRFPLRPADVKAEFIILNTAASLSCDSGVDHSSASASDHDAMLTRPELTPNDHRVVTSQPPMVASFKSVVKVETGLADSNSARLKRPRVKYLRKPNTQVIGSKSTEKKIKKESGGSNTGFYTPLRANGTLDSDANQASHGRTILQTKGKAKAAANSKKRRRPDSFGAADSASDGNEASREESPEHPADVDESRASGPAKVRKIAEGCDTTE